MAAKNDFSADEWKLLLESVMMSGIAVTAADPSGLWGTLKESFASAQTMASGKAGSSDLVKALVAEFETSQGRTIARDGVRDQLKGSNPAEMTAKSIDTLRRASALLDAKAAGDAADVEGVAAPDQRQRGGGLQGRRLSGLRRHRSAARPKKPPSTRSTRR